MSILGLPIPDCLTRRAPAPRRPLPGSARGRPAAAGSPRCA
jgi:hypothetical protein